MSDRAAERDDLLRDGRLVGRQLGASSRTRSASRASSARPPVVRGAATRSTRLAEQLRAARRDRRAGARPSRDAHRVEIGERLLDRCLDAGARAAPRRRRRRRRPLADGERLRQAQQIAGRQRPGHQPRSRACRAPPSERVDERLVELDVDARRLPQLQRDGSARRARAPPASAPARARRARVAASDCGCAAADRETGG